MDEPVVFRNVKAGIDLGGTITRPADDAPRAAVILVTGSGPQDRDQSIFGHKPFKTVAEFLGRRGYAVLRYDDRGVGQSGGAPEGTTMDFADDAEAALDFLSARLAVPVGFLGHSEGGTIGAIVAARRSETAFLVMLAGSALRGDRTLRHQIAMQLRLAGASEEHIARNDRNAERLIAATLRSGDALRAETEAVRRELGETMAWANAQAAFFGATWTRYFLAYDPARTLAALRLPVLALYGEKDVQVPAGPHRGPAEAALAPNARARVSVVAEVNHLFQTAVTGSPAEYASIAEDIAPAVLERIADWLDRRPE